MTSVGPFKGTFAEAPSAPHSLEQLFKPIRASKTSPKSSKGMPAAQPTSPALLSPYTHAAASFEHLVSRCPHSHLPFLLHSVPQSSFHSSILPTEPPKQRNPWFVLVPISGTSMHRQQVAEKTVPCRKIEELGYQAKDRSPNPSAGGRGGCLHESQNSQVCPQDRGGHAKHHLLCRQSLARLPSETAASLETAFK